MDRYALLAHTNRNRQHATPGAAQPGEQDCRLRTVCRELLERAGLGHPTFEDAVATIVVGDRSGGQQPARGSFAALSQALRLIETGHADRVIVAGLMGFDPNAPALSAHRATHGVCAVLLEAQSSLASRLIGRSRLLVVAHAESADIEDGHRTGILALLQRHADKTLYVDVRSALLPAINVVANIESMHIVDLACDVPHDADCLCLLQVISFFERYAAGMTSDARGAMFANDGARADDSAGVIVLAPVGAPLQVRRCD